MKKTIKKCIPFFLCLLMTLSVAPLSGILSGVSVLFPVAKAADTSGSCGADLSWEFDSSTGTLSFTGTGDMTDYWDGSSNRPPWYSYRNSITTLDLGSSITSIGNFAFANLTSLTSVVIPDTVTDIRQYAFNGCSALTDITFSNSLLSIGTMAFMNCSSLADFTFPNTLLTIGSNAFRGCKSITSLVLPNSVTAIGDTSFYECTELVSVTFSNSMTIVPKQSFCRCSKLANIDFGTSITEIGEEAFAVCPSIQTVTLPQSLVTLGFRAFLNTGLLSVSIPPNVRNIESEAFRQCKYLTSVFVPATVTNLSTHVFYECSGLESAELEEGFTSLPRYTFYDCVKLTDVTLPSTLLSIGAYAYYNCKLLESIDIPENVSSIGNNAFRKCSALTDVALPDALTTVSEGLFYDCSALESADIPDTVVSIEKYAFYHCSSLQAVDLPSGITKISASTFTGCSSLAQIDIPGSVTVIEDSAFYGCSSFTSIEIPDSVTSMGPHVLYECTSLTYAVLPKHITLLPSYTFYGCSSLVSVTFPEELTALGERVFLGCTSLVEIEIPEGVVSMGELVFHTCSNLERVVLPDSLETLGPKTFYHCDALYDVTLPSGLTSLPGSSFAYCSSLEEIELPETLTSIGTSAFHSCSSLESIVIPQTVESLGSSAFAACTSLIDITIPSALTSIPSSCFSGCTALNDISLPDTVTSIGASAFSGCQAITEFSFPPSLLTIENDAFKKTGLVNVTLPNGLESIGLEAFYDCDGLISVYIPDSVTSIGVRCFQNCGALNNVRFSESMTVIPDACFHECKALSSFSIPASVTSIGGSAFTNCPLTELVLPEGLVTIGDGAFRGIDIYELAVPASVTSIGSSAFNNTFNLTRVEITDLDKWLEISFSGKTANPMNNGAELWLNGKKLQVITVPMGLTAVKSYAFCGCTSVVRVDFPNSLQQINAGAFQNCVNLKNISAARNLTSIGESAFEGCASLEKADLYCASIGNRAFYSCSSLKDVRFLGNLSSLGTSAFYGCSSLVKIILPDSLTVIPSTAFFDCSSLVSVTFGANLTNISSQAFQNCVSLNSVVIPTSTRQLNQSCFSSCTSLKSFIVYSSDVTFSSIPLSKTADLTIYGIPGSTAQTYAETRNIPFEMILGAGYAEATVLDPEENDLTSDCSFIWKNSQGDIVATGRFLTTRVEGERYTLETVLGSSIAGQFASPATVTFTSGDDSPVIRLSEHEICAVNGVLTDLNSEPIPGASVQITEMFNDKCSNTVTLTTDENGAFSYNAKAVSLKIIYYADGYFHNEREVRAEKLASGSYDAGEKLIPIPENAVYLNFSFIESVVSGEEPSTFSLENDEIERIELFDATLNAPVEEFMYSDGVLTAENANGHTLRLTAYPKNDDLLPAQESFLYRADESVSVQVVFASKGGIKLTGVSFPGSAYLALLYDRNGDLLRRDSFSSYGVIKGLDEGSYTLVLIQNGSAFSAFATLAKIDAAGLVANEHYKRFNVTVANGTLTEISEVTVPSFELQDLLLPQVDSVELYASSTCFYPGQLITVTAFFSMKDDSASDYGISFNIPEGLIFYDGSVTVNGFLAEYSYIDGVLTVQPEETGIIRFIVYPSVADDLYIDAALSFTQGGEEFTQFFGGVSMTASVKGLNVISQTPDTLITVSGRTLPGSEVTLYRDGSVVAQVFSNAIGTWSAEIELPAYYSYFSHLFYAEIRNSLFPGEVFSTDKKICVYNINSNKIESIEMPKHGNAHGFKSDVTLSPVKINSIYYNINANQYSTYRVRLRYSDPERVKNVYVYLLDAYGDSLNVITCGYDEKTDSWVGSILNTSEVVNNLSSVCATFSEYESPQIVINDNAMDEGLELYNTIMDSLRAEIENGNITLETLPYEDYMTEEQRLSGIGAYDEETGLGLKLNKVNFPIANEPGDLYVAVTGTQTDMSGVDTFLMQHFFDEDGTEYYYGTKQEDTFCEINIYNVTQGTALNIRTAETPEIAMGRRMRMHASGAISLTLAAAGLPAGIIAAGAAGGGAAAAAATAIAGAIIAALAAGAGVVDVYQMKQAHDEMLAVFSEGLMSDCEDYRECIQSFGARVTALDQKYDQILDDRWGKDEKISVTLRAIETGDSILVKASGLYALIKELLPFVAKVIKTGFAMGLETLCLFWEAEDVSERDRLRTECEKVTAEMKSCPQCSEDPPPPPPEDNPNGPFCPIRPLIDPSGYAYEAVPSNRVTGATAKIWYYDASAGTEVLWDAENYDQINPQITDEEGRFQWDVPAGKWLVTLEKEGYYPADSRMDVAADQDGYLPVPPPQTEVNTAMVSTAAPEVTNVCVYEDGVKLIFSQYIQIDSVSSDTVTVICGGEAVEGAFTALNAEYDYTGENQYATMFMFTPAEALSGNVSVTAQNIVNYAGAAMAEAFEFTGTPDIAPEDMVVPESVSPAYNSGSLIHIAVTPAAAGAGKTVSAVSNSPAIVEVVNSSVVLDENGEGNVMVSGLLPGSAEVVLTLDGTGTERTVLVNVGDITTSENKCEKVVSSVESYSVVDYGTLVTLTTATDGAEIYYTLDGTCPCLTDNAARTLYTGPIEVTENMFLIAYAVKDGFEDSNTAGYVYLLRAPEHNYIASVTPPTCTERGCTTYVCSDCGDSYVDDYVDALGHSYGELIAGSAATCFADGAVDHYVCARCGLCFDADKNEINSLVIPCPGHDYGEWIAEKAPSCETPGTKGRYHCSRCGGDFDENKETLNDLSIPASGHDYGEWINAVPASCTENGTVGHFHCDRCEKDFDENREAIVKTVIPAAGHSFGEWTVTKEATETEAGERVRECSVCHEKQTERIPATQEGLCPLCHEKHEGFFGSIVGFFHRIIYFFKNLFD
ncbi:MAG: leucine-rich repeat protein [Clostridia bacterium]|nr:leucine-rich repeat protein [Clostridia bacterium]